MISKNFIAITLLALFSHSALAQPDEEPTTASYPVCYTYDETGNRVSSSLCVKSNYQDDDKGKGEASSSTDEFEKKAASLASQWRVYPNPTENFLFIDIQDATVFDVHLIDLNGKTQIRERREGYARERIDVSALPSGEYILEVRAGDVLKSWTIIKQ